jgi:hypothetical protein
MLNELRDITSNPKIDDAIKPLVSSNLDELFDRLDKVVAKKYGSGTKAYDYWKSLWEGKEGELLERVLKLESENGSRSTGDYYTKCNS